VSDTAGNGHHHERPALNNEDDALDYVRARYKAYDGKQDVLAYTPKTRKKKPQKKKIRKSSARRRARRRR